MSDELTAPERLRMWKPDDYPMLKSWWEGHGWNAVPLCILPPLGVICDDAAAGFAYMDNGGTGVAMMEWMVTDPNAGLRGVKALHHVVTWLSQELKRMDYGAILTTCRQPALARFLEKRGFNKTDEGVIHLIKLQPH